MSKQGKLSHFCSIKFTLLDNPTDLKSCGEYALVKACFYIISVVYKIVTTNDILFPDEPVDHLHCNFDGGNICDLYLFSTCMFMDFELVSKQHFDKARIGGLSDHSGKCKLFDHSTTKKNLCGKV